MTKEEIDACSRDPRNRKLGIFYGCKADPRVVVPKRIKWMGWTINVAHPHALPVTLGILAILIGPGYWAASRDFSLVIVLLIGAASITTICVLCAYLSSRY